MWGLFLVLPLVASFLFTQVETRTLRPSARGPTHTDGFCAPAYDVHVDRHALALRLALGMLAVYGVLVFAKRSPKTKVTIEHSP